MKVIYMGTPDFSVGPLLALIEGGVSVELVVTQPDKAKGRSGQKVASPVKECALKYGIEVFQPDRIRNEEAVEKLKSYDADAFIVAAFGQILSEEILNLPKYGCINIHASLLPKYRGAAPIQWSIIDGEKETGVTIMQMDKGIDTGDILTQKIVPITDCDTGETLFDKLSKAGSSLLLETLPLIEAGKIQPVKQDSEKSSYAKMLSKQLGNLNFGESAQKLDWLIRGLTSWPGAYTFYNGKMVKIWKEKPIMDESSDEGQDSLKECAPGQIAKIHSDSIDVVCKEGLLRIYEIQMEGKKRMSIHDFMLGHAFHVGDCFTSER